MEKELIKNIIIGILIVLTSIALCMIDYTKFDTNIELFFKNIPIFTKQGYSDKDILITQKTLKEWNKKGGEKLLIQNTKNVILKKMIQNGFSGFITTPNQNNTLRLSLSGNTAITTGNISEEDTLDLFIKEYYKNNKLYNNFYVPYSIRENFHKIYLFKTKEDIDNLGYEVISQRTRINNDAQYRRYNIQKAFEKFGNIRVINAGEIVSFIDNIELDELSKNYKYGLGIYGDQEILMYGGGVCGASTAIYQGIILNKSLKTPERRNHSNRYSNLYQANINGTKIITPGLDSTIYQKNIDLKIQNVSNHPIILITNFDGNKGSTEEIFTLGQSGDLGSIQFKSKYTSSTNRTCYIRTINGTDKESCYRKIQ